MCKFLLPRRAILAKKPEIKLDSGEAAIYGQLQKL